MIRWQIDENFNNNMLRALLRKKPGIDVIRVQDVGLTGTSDEDLLAWAAIQNRILLTHDVSTITAHAYKRIMNGERMPGVFEVSLGVAVRTAVEDIILLSECSEPDEWESQVRYLPLR